MKQRPILFSPPMVRSILENRKSQTRRVIKVQPSSNDLRMATLIDACIDRKNVGKSHWVRIEDLNIVHDDGIFFSCPFGKIGDHLWVKETCVISPPDWNDGSFCNAIDQEGRKRIVQYVATDECMDAAHDYGLKKTPSIFMPRWASRILLEIVNIRVERLQDISEEDAIAEGVRTIDVAAKDGATWCDRPIRAYRFLWDSINGNGSWDLNPHVWVIDFRKI